MPNMMRWIIPKEKFFGMIAKQSGNALEGAEELKKFINDYAKFERSERKSKAHAIKKIEHKGGEISRDITKKLNKAFITSIGKEDMRQISVLLDDITSLIGAAALRFVILGIERIDGYIIQLVDIAYNAINELNNGILGLGKLKHAKDHYAKIHSLKNQADDVYHKALSELFHFYKNSIDIIKYKEIYELLESLMEKCEDAAYLIFLSLPNQNNVQQD